MQGFKKVTVDKTVYEIHEMAPSKALRILTRIFKLAGIPLGQFASSVDDNDSLLKKKVDTDLIGKAVEKLAENMDEETVHDTVFELLECVRDKGGLEIDPDIHFQGKIFHMLKVVKEVLTVNYADFFGGLSVVSKAARRLAVTKSGNPA